MHRFEAHVGPLARRFLPETLRRAASAAYAFTRSGRANPARWGRALYNARIMPAKLERLRIESAGARIPGTAVEQHWTHHTIATTPIASPGQSVRYIDSIDRQYPLYFRYCDLYADHAGEVVLDYGCGPGNDLTGYFLRSKAASIIGVDVSMTALEQARFRLALHDATSERVRLIKKSEGDHTIPLPDNSVDYLQSLGVLHHVSDPLGVLRELYRVLEPGRFGRAMVYNHHSLFLHFAIPYEMQIEQGRYPGMTAYEAFQSFGDAGAPICLAYTPDAFAALAGRAGFRAEFVGAAFSVAELIGWRRKGEAARSDPRLAEEHRRFLAELAEDADGYPRYRGHTAGMSAIFKLHKPAG
jgi:ubiquinone/menaquinone biosynthesis C-methylase UbiE